jgi:hypothetical protein
MQQLQTSRVNSIDAQALAARTQSYYATIEKPTMVSDFMEKLASLSEES